MTGPLDGIRVIDVTSAVLGPVATQILGNLGADVVKVEPPEGDPMRNLGPARHEGMAAMFLGLNRNKRSVVLDLKKPQARAALGAMVAQADVFVHNMRPDAAARLRIDYAHLEGVNSRLVYASASGYRADGPYRGKPAFDDIIQGASGIAGLFQRASGEARYAPFIIADKTIGYVLASTIVTALLSRERTGRGQEVRVPMYETMVEFNLIEHFWGRAFDPPLAKPGYSRIFNPERRPFRTKDGVICVTATTDQQWRRLFTAVGRPDLAEDERFASMARRTHHFAEAYRILETELATRGTDAWTEIFDAVDLPNGPANGLDDLFDDPYLNEIGLFRRYEHPTEGSLVSTTPPISFSGTPLDAVAPPPRLGEHTRSVLAEAGLDEARIAELLIATEGRTSTGERRDGHDGGASPPSR